MSASQRRSGPPAGKAAADIATMHPDCIVVGDRCACCRAGLIRAESLACGVCLACRVTADSVAVTR